jgi:molecular chaperone DnaK
VGIPPSPRGVPQIEVLFEVDANGIVSVSALEKTTGREQQMKITPTSGLAPEEIDRLLREAEDHADSDRNAKDTLILRNKLDSLLRNTKKSFMKFGGMLPQDQQEGAERLFGEAEAAVKSERVDEMKKTLSSLELLAGQLTTAMMNPTPDTTTSEV